MAIRLMVLGLSMLPMRSTTLTREKPAMRPDLGSAATSSLCLAPPRSDLSSAYSVRSFLLMGTSRQPLAGASPRTPTSPFSRPRSHHRPKPALSRVGVLLGVLCNWSYSPAISGHFAFDLPVP